VTYSLFPQKGVLHPEGLGIFMEVAIARCGWGTEIIAPGSGCGVGCNPFPNTLFGCDRARFTASINF